MTRLDGRTRVTLADGKDYILRYDMNALAAFEEETGTAVPALEKLSDAEEIGIRHLRGLLWAGLLHDHPRMTVKQAGTLIPPDQIEETGRAIAEGIRAVFPNATQDEDGGAPGEAVAPPETGPGNAS